MAEYIEREKAYEMLNGLGGCDAEPESWADGWDKAIDTAIDKLNKIPTADVRPERHGYWAICSDGYYPYCSECKEEPKNGVMSDFCSKCGAKMDGSGKSDNWIATSEQLPVENQIVETKIDDENGVRNEQELIYSHNLWFFPDMSMYVYYTPTHWRRKERAEGKDGESDENSPDNI